MQDPFLATIDGKVTGLALLFVADIQVWESNFQLLCLLLLLSLKAPISFSLHTEDNIGQGQNQGCWAGGKQGAFGHWCPDMSIKVSWGVGA